MAVGCVVVTGAASGIGRAICVELNRKGFVAALWDINKAGLEKLSEELCVPYKERCSVVDITNHHQVAEVVLKVEAELGPITCLVNNAGVLGTPCLFKNEPIENWLNVVNVNNIGMLNVTSTILPLMAGRKSGHIVNISSIAGKSAIETRAVYSAGKYFIEGFSQGLRRECLRDGIKVTVIRPGAVNTNLGASSTRSKDNEDMDPESKLVNNEYVDRILAHNLPWVMDAEDVGKAVVQVLSLPDSVVINELNISAIGLPE